MAFGSSSAVFRAAVTDMVCNTTAMDLNSDSFKVALFGNSGTPDKDAAAASTAYNTGQWTTANEVSHSGQWAAGGIALASVAVTNPSSGVVMLDAADTASGSAATLANVYGCLIYDDTLTTPVADQGLCFNAFGGANSVTTGTFTVIWNSLGILRFAA